MKQLTLNEVSFVSGGAGLLFHGLFVALPTIGMAVKGAALCYVSGTPYSELFPILGVTALSTAVGALAGYYSESGVGFDGGGIMGGCFGMFASMAFGLDDIVS